jgi:hypothetical protein
MPTDGTLQRLRHLHRLGLDPLPHQRASVFDLSDLIEVEEDLPFILSVTILLGLEKVASPYAALA